MSEKKNEPTIDYAKMLESNSNGVVLQYFISHIVNSDSFSIKSLPMIAIKMGAIVLMKGALDDTKTYLDKFKVADLSAVRYWYQWSQFSEEIFTINLINGKWRYGEDKIISKDTLGPFLEMKSIYMTQPGTYYLTNAGNIIKICVKDVVITFHVPNRTSAIEYVKNEILRKNEERICGEKTKIYRFVLTTHGVPKMEPQTVSDAFSTPNYRKLVSAIKCNNLTNKLLKTAVIPYVINFDGKPGTGKTSFGNFIAGKGIFDRVIIYNMVQFCGDNFLEMITKLERQIESGKQKDRNPEDGEEQILIILDEVDKWLDSYINHQIMKMREEARSSKETKDDKGTVVSQKTNKLSCEEEFEKRSHLRNEFMDGLYRLVDGHILPDTRRYVIIFNTNHFDKMFGGLDAKYDALRNRFHRYIFGEIGKTCIKEWIDSICQTIQRRKEEDPSLAKLNPDIDINTFSEYNPELFDNIDPDFRISYRNLYKVLRSNSFNINNALIELSTNKDFDKFDLDMEANEDSVESNIESDISSNGSLTKDENIEVTI